jgi:hypothetical protein
MENVPFHIQEIAKLYHTTDTSKNNLADGRIENWNDLVSGKYEFPTPGAHVFINTSLYLHFKTRKFVEIWVHLSAGYFKQLVKTQLD